jgi:2-aminoadipate transaminase
MNAIQMEHAASTDTLWDLRFAQRTLGVSSSTIRELLKLTEQPDIISFAGGLPAPEVFPIERIEEATRYVLETHGRAALQYSTTEGYLPLRELLVRHMARYGIKVTPSHILITAAPTESARSGAA